MPNNLSPKLHVKPAEKPVTYRLIGAGEKDYFTGKPIFKAAYVMPGSTTIFDKDDADGNYNKTLRYIKSVGLDVNGNPEEEVGEVVWENENRITVRPDQYALYEFLERHDGNASNPFRNKSKRAIFERVDNEAKAKQLLDNEEAEFQAVSMARTMGIDALVAYARALSVNVNREAAEIRYDMVQKAKKDPVGFVKNAGSRMSSVRAAISRAQDEYVIYFDPASRAWRWKHNHGTFHTVAPGDNHIDAIANFILTETLGESVLKEINKRLGVEEVSVAEQVLTASTPAPLTEVVRKPAPVRKPAKDTKKKPAKEKAESKPASENTPGE